MSPKATAAEMLRAAGRADRPPPSPLTGHPSPVTGTPGRKWEEANRKMVFYCPEDVEGLIRAEMEKSGRSKSQVIAETLRERLGH